MIVIAKLRNKEYIVDNGTKILAEFNEVSDTITVPAISISENGEKKDTVVLLEVLNRMKSEKKITFRKHRRNAKYRKVGSRQPATMFIVKSIV